MLQKEFIKRLLDCVIVESKEQIKVVFIGSMEVEMTL